MSEQAPITDPSPGMYLTILPGPTRKRTPGLYYYRLVYRDPQPDTPGCAAVWEVRGGRLRYQIAWSVTWPAGITGTAPAPTRFTGPKKRDGCANTSAGCANSRPPFHRRSCTCAAPRESTHGAADGFTGLSWNTTSTHSR